MPGHRKDSWLAEFCHLIVSTDKAGRLVAIHHWHVTVAKNQVVLKVVLLRGHLSDGLLTVVSFMNLLTRVHSQALQDDMESVDVKNDVVHHQNPQIPNRFFFGLEIFSIEFLYTIPPLSTNFPTFVF